MTDAAGSAGAAGTARQHAADAVGSVREHAGDAAGTARQAARSEPVKVGARIGLVAYGITHLLVAWLALHVAFGTGGGRRTDQNGAFQTIAAQPFGRVLLWVLVIGFVAVGLWRLGQAVFATAGVQDVKEQVKKRVESGARAAVFLALAAIAAKVAAGGGSSGGGQKAAAGVLGWPGGRFLVGIVGLAILAVAVMKAKHGWEKKFLEEMNTPSDRHARQVVERLGQVGSIAKAVSVGLIGVLVVVAAVRFDPSKANGLDPALKALAGQPFGMFLLAAVALGLAAYGVFCFFDAKYHRV
jgi:Domain of Unknown Function (DUF1206)